MSTSTSPTNSRRSSLRLSLNRLSSFSQRMLNQMVLKAEVAEVERSPTSTRETSPSLSNSAEFANNEATMAGLGFRSGRTMSKILKAHSEFEINKKTVQFCSRHNCYHFESDGAHQTEKEDACVWRASR